MDLASTPARPCSFARGWGPLALTLLASAVCWGALFTAFPPAEQNFPFHDDWAYVRGATLFARGKGFHYFHWAAMPQLGQWLWAAPFLWAGARPAVALRVSTIVLSWLGLGGFYDLLRQEGGFSPPQAGWATATLAANPLLFLLQGTFMTDVPALSFALLALALYCRALRDGRAGVLAAAVAVAALAVTTRQNTVAVPAAAVWLLARDPRLRRKPLWVAGVVLPAALGVGVHLWFQGRPDAEPSRPYSISVPLGLFLTFFVFHSLGPASLPLLVLRPPVGKGKIFAAALALMTAGAVGCLRFGNHLPYGGLFPHWGNILSPWGAVGEPPGFPFEGLGDRPVLLGRDLRVALTVAGCLGGAGLLTRLVEQFGDKAWGGLLLPFTLLQVIATALAPQLIDRYLLFVIPGGLFVVGRGGSAAPRLRTAAAACLALSAAFSVCVMHDWVAWNSARWALGRRAVDMGIRPQDIEGGLEWDGWYAPEGRARVQTWEPQGLTLIVNARWFPHVTGRYGLAFSEVPGTITLDREPYSLWLVPGRREMVRIRQADPTGVKSPAVQPGPPPRPAYPR